MAAVAAALAAKAPCPLCHIPCDVTLADLVSVTCSMKGCDENTLYHADCIREFYLGKPSIAAPGKRGFKATNHHSEKTRSLHNCELDGLCGCVHGVDNPGTKSRLSADGTLNAFTDCNGRVVESGMHLRKKAEKKPAAAAAAAPHKGASQAKPALPRFPASSGVQRKVRLHPSGVACAARGSRRPRASGQGGHARRRREEWSLVGPLTPSRPPSDSP